LPTKCGSDISVSITCNLQINCEVDLIEPLPVKKIIISFKKERREERGKRGKIIISFKKKRREEKMR
jgi:hypothetical protein